MLPKTITYKGYNGLQISATAQGPADGFPVLLAHGGGQTRHAWAKTLDELADAGFRATAIDMRGHGESEWASEGGYDMSDFAGDLASVAGKLSRPPALIGASLGGLAGLIAAGELAPQKFASLTLVDIAPKMEVAGVSRVVEFMQAYADDGFSSHEEASQVISKYMPDRKKKDAPRNLARYLRARDNGRFYWHWDPQFIRQVSEARERSEQSYEEASEKFSVAAEKLTLPVHLVRGGTSDMVSQDAVRHFQTLVPKAAFTDIADAGHMVVGDRNDVFCEAIIGFLNLTHKRHFNP
ncbi:alpha/beta hydrolase [Altererythrobacter sp. RZ02]|uniref:Alpha/beta hydrolase n=1 Tax=Pontixanthobacter rizhaonensis TaxID=2730337 RepID=A0A848QM65_9SPHN|nr:alpha/beta hydrolase [Pontixanthobacter rizhaonensis]NMW31265.1 alpha/beta hydrolase [Pontixanthobacter rizhaonensis]